ncbi:antibiotic biosynthesis monooxygenase [Nodosilinea sp. PGN35]|uniref:antibiotic biosynthesis monooxygenase n=1 Tax=Nodosilinea sp. PGN35 TaxID=3020489 RepID=UPI0023B28E56|nr:antibiotic biosynthesis monooxygenase [Nodosilinea sp. TSF1-S3]MDF0368567.1 antibiotic biosynthesis monooxygenase [Nodosilinea sp. TSF1-S3]
MVFKDSGGAIAVVSLYKTDPAAQADAVKSFYKLTKSFYKTIPGFYGLALFSSVDGARVVVLSQWADDSSYAAFQASLTSGEDDYTKYYEKYAGSKSGKGSKSQDQPGDGLGEPFLSATFTIDRVVSPPGMVSAIPGGTALVQIAEIAADSPAQQADLVAAAHLALADLPQFYPAPRTAVLLTGVDTPHVALLAHWGTTAEFSDLNQVPQIALATEESAPAFTPDSHLYRAIKVINPKAETYGKG